MQNIVILGATSVIAQATARLYAADKASFVLLARDERGLKAAAADLVARGAARVETIVSELADPSQVTATAARITEIMPSIDLFFVAYGSLPDQREAETNSNIAVNQIMINFTSIVVWLLQFAEYFEKRNRGTIAVISSVAGDRGRKRNYLYGAAKGGLSVFLEGLTNRLHSHGVRVISLKPGFVDTPMTAAFKKGVLFSTPEKAAHCIQSAIKRGRAVAYIPWFWQPIMCVIKMIPSCIFKRMNI